MKHIETESQDGSISAEDVRQRRLSVLALRLDDPISVKQSRRLIDKHYGRVAQLALEVFPQALVVPKKGQAAFKELRCFAHLLFLVVPKPESNLDSISSFEGVLRLALEASHGEGQVAFHKSEVGTCRNVHDRTWW